MEKLLKLQAKLAEISASMDALLANSEEGFTDEQRNDLKALEADYKKTSEAIQAEEQKIARAEKQRELAERIDQKKQAQAERELEEKEKAQTEQAQELARTQRELALAQRQGRQVHNSRLTDTDLPEAVRQQAACCIPATIKRCSSVKNFKGVRNGYTAEERAFRFGMWLYAKMSNDIPSRFKFNTATEWVQKNLAGVKSNDASGYFNLIPEEFGTDLIDLREQFGVARRLFRMVTMQSDTRTDPRRKGGLTAYGVAEGAAGTESNKLWDNVRLTAKDIMVLSRYTNQVSMDSVISVGDDLAREIAYAFTTYEDQAAFNGDGTSTYSGITGVRAKLQDCAVPGAGTDSFGLVVGTAGTGTSYGSFTLSDFHAVVAKLPQYADMGMKPSWVCHRGFYFLVMQRLEMAAGGTTMMEIATGDRSPRPMFMGYPVDWSQVFPITPATSQVVCTLGDYTLGASFGDRQMDEVSFSEHATIGGVSLWETNQMGIRGTERFDINVHDVGSSTEAGPIVGLETAHS